MTWRLADRLDRQVADLWAVVAASALTLVPLWRSLLPALPPCPMRALTGIPCPSCGSTRAAAALLGGRLVDAVLFNPLLALAAFAFVLGGLVAPLWVRWGGRLPEWTIAPSRPVRLAMGLVLTANWAYVILRGI